MLHSHWKAFSVVSSTTCLLSCCCISLSTPYEALQCSGGNSLCIPRLFALWCDVQSFANTPGVHEVLLRGDAATPVFYTDASNGIRCRAHSSVPQIYSHSQRQDTAWEETGRSWTVPSLLQQSRGTEGCSVLHRDSAQPQGQREGQASLSRHSSALALPRTRGGRASSWVPNPLCPQHTRWMLMFPKEQLLPCLPPSH